MSDSNDQKYTRFRSVPQFTRDGNYHIDLTWNYLEQQIEAWTREFRLELDPDFQRAHVWDDEKRSRYVEFILRGGRSSREVYFNCSSWHTDFSTPLQLVDGKQRIEAVRKFLRGEIRAFGSLFHEYTDTLPTMHCYFSVHINDLPTRADLLRWYLDLNSGGVVHTEAELQWVRGLLSIEEEVNHETAL